ncbi:threonine synthase [Sedimentibacter hydroxybenzoicus DSM 7310]|uniref:Threonine synthase n=1 Tax=Sedimentibacter hydroxybenzoicus DSM 7310 TaxID=1123245 RepID=A0A974BM35_SEDHY|nr:threonine synthase [Sedimentibacter hydroxybenzoicus]NYB75678.1 threonine synthase [Sedimentibacter hydroxybenzoicus DSM 7310]
MKYICSKCNAEEEVTTYKAKCDCGGLFKLDYKPPKFDLSLIDRNTWSIFRYRNFMALMDEQWRNISLGEGMTPTIKFDDDVILKMDYFMPTLSFKDRGAAVLISHCKSIGVESVVQDSSGNAGNSIAAYCAKANIDCEIFVPEGTSPKKIDMIKSHNARVNVVPGSRDNCADVCRAKVETEGKYYANHVYNPFFYEGTKTYVYEVYEQLNRIPQNIFVPLGNGTLFIGIIKGLEELIESNIINKMPNIIAVQGENCDPFIKAFENKEKQPALITPQPTMAEGIAIGIPMRGEEILEYIYKYNIEMITAPENQILNARASLAAKGIYCEHTTAATYAAYLKYCKLYGKTPDSLIPMCGAGLKSDH